MLSQIVIIILLAILIISWLFSPSMDDIRDINNTLRRVMENNNKILSRVNTQKQNHENLVNTLREDAMEKQGVLNALLGIKSMKQNSLTKFIVIEYLNGDVKMIDPKREEIFLIDLKEVKKRIGKGQEVMTFEGKEYSFTPVVDTDF